MPIPDLHHRYADKLPGAYQDWQSEGFAAPELLFLNTELAAELGLDPEWLRAEGATWLSGNQVLPGSHPIAQVYAGHQFGGFNPQLGDGRAVLLGELQSESGLWDLALKGSGRTHYSRGGDGRASVGPVLREYLMGRAMHRLGVPTTRALAVVATGEQVYREQMLPGAVLARVAASHLRVGTAQYFSAKGDTETLARLVTFALDRHFPQRAGAADPALALLEEVVKVQAQLIARWMSIGFIHGVMNTDNTTLSGETIDYGPCAFMDRMDPGTVYSSIDHQSRYAYSNQPGIGQWNLTRLAEALLPLIGGEKDAAVEAVTAAIKGYAEHYDQAWLAAMGAKLGMTPGAEDRATIQGFLDLMEKQKVDFTQGFRRLSAVLRGGGAAGCGVFPELGAFKAWAQGWMGTLAGDREQIADRIDAVNPIYIPRNHLVEQAISAGLKGDLEPARALMEVLDDPYQERAGSEVYALPASAEFEEGYQTFCGT